MTSHGVSGLRLDQVLIYAAVFLSPFLDWSLDVAFFTLSDAIYCAALAVILLRRSLPASPLGVLVVPWTVAFLMIVGGLHMSSMVAGDAVRGIVLLMQYGFCFIVLPYLLLGQTTQEAYRLLLVFVAGVAVLDLHGIYTFYAIGYVPGSAVVSGNGRLETLLGGANAAACLNATMIVVVLWLRTTGRLSFLTSALLFCVMLVAIVLMSSNSGLIATTVGVLSFLVLTLKPRMMLRIVPILALPAVFLMAGGSSYLPQAFMKRVLNPVVEGGVSEAGTFGARSMLMQEALDLINREQVVVVGMGADQFRARSVQGAPVHNTFLLLWAEGGLVSLLGWLLFCSMGFLLWFAARARGVAPNARAAVLACFLVFFFMTNVSAHVYARYWYTALLLIMQPTLIALAASSRPVRWAARQAGRVNHVQAGVHPSGG